MSTIISVGLYIPHMLLVRGIQRVSFLIFYVLIKIDISRCY